MSLILTLNPIATPVPWGALTLASYASAVAPGISIETRYDTDAKSLSLNDSTLGSVLTDYFEILGAIALRAGLNDHLALSSKFVETAKALSGKLGFTELATLLDGVDDHLAYRTYLTGHSPTLPDWAVWGAIKGSLQAIGVLKKNSHIHLSRWYTHLDSISSTQAVYTSLNEAKSSKKKAATESATFALGLPGAVEGGVVTRFPPEPSGYLHIGHAKAALLNQHFAKMYKGKMIVRFDDTNPSKEKSEFEVSILEDLALLGIEGDQITHTSDYFSHLYEQCVKLLTLGNAYADDTEQQQMRAERMDGIASKRRDSSVQDNLSRFSEMTKGSTEGQRWCIRAKISVDDPNKALRDPVIYRGNPLPHHRTGDKWKVYPTYDFACPLVDSLEGVTHALRTNEYRDRNPQYQWMLDALGLRKVEVWDFSRINFIYTLLSKRKLHWFVENKLVYGWDDPRFPTVRGIRRRGLTIEALRAFMLAQGPSQAQMQMEWDQIWTTNKKIIDPIAPRFWSLHKERLVPVTLTNGPTAEEVKDVPKHKKNPDVGTKKTVYSSKIFVEQEDAVSFEDQEEVTLMDWGNAFIRKKVFGPEGEVTSIEAELFLEGDFKKTKKKITWLPQPTASHQLVNVTLLDYDYLITKKKLEEDDNVADFVTPVTEFAVEAFADANVTTLRKGDIVQFERKGYYILDSTTTSTDGNGEGRFNFINIPDGRAAGVASKATPGVAAPLEKKVVAAGGWGKDAQLKSKATKALSTTGNDRIILSDGDRGFPIPVTTSMYDVPILAGAIDPKADTKMYEVDNVYHPKP
ncbi:glutamate-tRNA ligase [Cantharellus anzutake]|uniref:glutamate-tRNA ligase n=1 Tax=Cantharellus anzutake TaxID=1750568 RepID=UPI0019088150|nr:glutamate-tRNA ligase [Cantharellus anzutake]KAF8344285.1 glutamate-tRNA ligase [Cantharellus anzutake]